MKTRAFLGTIGSALLLLTLCPNLSAQVELKFVIPGESQTAAAPQEDPLAELNASAAVRFRARSRPVGRSLRVIQGGRLRLTGLSADESARRFLADLSEYLQYDDDWRTEISRRGEGRRAHLRFFYDDIEIDGAPAIIVQDDDAIVGSATNLPRLSRVLGTFRLTRNMATAHAREAVQLLRRRQGQYDRIDWLPPRSERRFFATDDGLVPAWLVEERAVGYGDAFALYIDARNGDLLHVIYLNSHGTGKYPYVSEPGGFIAFNTKDGEGKVFKNQKHARNGKVTKLTLKQISRGVAAPSLASKGYVVGARADTWDDNGNDAFNTKLKFNYNPFGSGTSYDNFDQVNTLYHIEKFYQHLKGAIGQNPDTNFSLAVICNIQAVDINAFFSMSPFPGDGHCVGYLAFFDTTWANPANPNPALDISRDPTVVAHEYTHAWLAFEALSFTGNLDDPSRAVNEAMADFYSVSFHKDKVIGRYAADWWGSGIKRNLQDDDHFPETTVASMAISQGGLPEEHMNGEVFGSFLVDMRERLGTKTTEKFVYDSLPFMPHQMSDVGYGTVTVGNAVAATEAFFRGCVTALVFQAATEEQTGAALGAAAARGMINFTGCQALLTVNLEAMTDQKFKFYSSVVKPNAEQVFYFTADQGRMLTVKAVGEKGSGFKPSFTVTPASGNPSDILETKSQTVENNGRVVIQEDIQLNAATPGLYLVTVTGNSGTKGRYVLTIDA